MMANFIHPTALIDPKAQIGSDNYIGPFCVIGPNVVMGSRNRLESHISIGTPAQHRDYFRKEPGKVVIGDDNVFREFVTINGGTTDVTQVGNRTSLLIGAHVGHDAIVKDQVNLGNNVVLGGHSIIGFGANLGLATVVHQHRVIGACAMVGMNSTVTRDLPPFLIAFGSPCDPQRVNRVGLERNGVATADLALFEDWFQKLQGQYEKLTPLQHVFNRYLIEFEKDRLKNQSVHAATGLAGKIAS